MQERSGAFFREAATGQPVVSGEISGAAWIGQIPDNWNGDLVIYAHGYRGEGLDLTVNAAPEFEFLVEQGFAWAPSSYRRNSYDPGIGVRDTKNVTRKMERLLRRHGRVDNTYITGYSMGGPSDGRSHRRCGIRRTASDVPVARPGLDHHHGDRHQGRPLD